MELQMKKQTLSINEAAFDGQSEQPVEADLLLPDYCPDIQRVLHCSVDCLVQNIHGEQQSIRIEGELRIHVLYVGDNGALRAAEQKQSFVRTLDSKLPLQQPLCEVSCRCDYLNCRAVSNRRLEVRGALTLSIRALNCTPLELVSQCEGLGIQLKSSTLSLDRCLSHREHNFSVREELDLGEKQPIAQVLSTHVSALLSDHKVISDRVVAKGELQVQILYLPLSADEQEAPQELKYCLPFSQILPKENGAEDSDCCISCQVSGWDIQAKSDLDGEMKRLDVEVELRAVVSVHQKQTLSFVQDCYSTLHPVEQEEKQLSFFNFIRSLQEEQSLRKSLPLNSAVSTVLAAWVRVKESQSRQKDQCLQLTAVLGCYALVLDGEGQPQIYEDSIPVEQCVSLNEQQQGELFGLQWLPTQVEAVLNQGQLDFRCCVHISGCLYRLERQKGISHLQVDESSCLKQAGDCTVALYYAEAGESVWEIAKKHQSAFGEILRENGLEQDTLPQRTMLLIPLC